MRKRRICVVVKPPKRIKRRKRPVTPATPAPAPPPLPLPPPLPPTPTPPDNEQFLDDCESHIQHVCKSFRAQYKLGIAEVEDWAQELRIKALSIPEEKRTAPLPDAVINAKKIFVSNGGGSNLAFDAFYSALKTWGKYTFVGSPGDADLIVELAYRLDYGRTRIWSNERCRDATTQIHRRQTVNPQLVLAIYDAKTKNSLWSEVNHRRLARREKNREKEMVNSADRLVEDLRIRFYPLFRSPFPVTTPAKNCKIILNPFHPTTYQLSPAPKTGPPRTGHFPPQAILRLEKPPTGSSNFPQGRPPI